MRHAALAGLAVAAVVFAVAMAAGRGGSPAPSERATATAGRTSTSAPARAGARPDGREVFARMGCGSCHRLAAAGSTGGMGPSLDARLPHHTQESLRSKILDPSGSTAYTGMPTNFGERMSRAELDALVGFLLRADR